MQASVVRLGKRTVKYGGKSGILPEVRPVFKKFPIRPKTDEEVADAEKLEQGYAEDVPLPKKKGFVFHRKPVDKPVLSVQERIKLFIDDRAPKVDKSTLSGEELWAVQRDEIRREHLKSSYLAEAKRLENLDALKLKKEQQQKQLQQAQSNPEESRASQLTLPTVDSYLDGPIMRQRTPEEQAIVDEQRTLNRKVRELETMEANAEDLLELYHAAGTYITTEEELEAAIHEAFEVKVGRFESSERLLEDKLFGYYNNYLSSRAGEKLIKDAAFGEINGSPGLETINETLSGEAEKARREAQRKLNHE